MQPNFWGHTILLISVIKIFCFATLASEKITPSSAEKPEDTIQYTPVVPQPLHIPLLPKTPILRQENTLFTCNDCTPEHRRWFSEIPKLKRAAYFCGYDYLEIRITQFFSGEVHRGTITVFAHSLHSDSLLVDSVITTFISPTTKQKLSAVYYQQAQPITLPSRIPTGLKRHYTQSIDAVIRHTGTFSAGCMVQENGGKHPVWYFALNNILYHIEDGKLHITSLHNDNTLKMTSNGYTEYRLGSWGNIPIYPGPHHMEQGQPPVIKRFSVNDTNTLCRVRIECESTYGLHHCIVTSASHRDTIYLNGELYQFTGFTFDAHPHDTILFLQVTDKKGTSAYRSIPLFTNRRAKERERNTHRMVQLVTEEQSHKNPLTFGMYCLSQMSGNPVSYISGKILERQAKNRIAAIRDFTVPESEPITFPCEGTIYPERLSTARGVYSTTFYADNVSMNSSHVDSVCNPVLCSSGNNPYTFTISAPLMNGKYPIRWSFDTSVCNLIRNKKRSSLLVCSDAQYRHSKVHLRNIPCILATPKQNVQFALCHMIPNVSSDTLTYTCYVRYTDRSADMLHYQMVFQNGVTASTVSSRNSPLMVEQVVVDQRNGEVCFIVPIKLSCRKKIFRVDTFVHSIREKGTTGWGALACQG